MSSYWSSSVELNSGELPTANQLHPRNKHSWLNPLQNQVQLIKYTPEIGAGILLLPPVNLSSVELAGRPSDRV